MALKPFRSAARNLDGQGRRAAPAPMPGFDEAVSEAAKARAAEIARKHGIDPTGKSPREIAHTLIRALAAKRALAPQRHRMQWAWTILHEFQAGKRSPLELVKAAEALGLSPKEALRRAEAGWSVNGPPATREPGDDTEAERAA